MSDKALTSHQLANKLLTLPNSLIVIKTRKKTRHYALVKNAAFRENLSLLVTENAGDLSTEYTQRSLASLIELERAF